MKHGGIFLKVVLAGWGALLLSNCDPINIKGNIGECFKKKGQSKNIYQLVKVYEGEGKLEGRLLKGVGPKKVIVDTFDGAWEDTRCP